MTTGIASLLGSLGATRGLDVRPEDVLRLDVARDGSLVLSLELRGRACWYALREGDWRALTPELDERLPIARRAAEPGVGLLSWRPGRRMTLRQERDGAPVVLKGYRARRSAPAAIAHRVALAASAGSALRAPELRGHDGSEETLELEDVAGSRLDLGSPAPASLYRVGDALRRVQDAEAGAGAALSRHDRAAELEVLDAWCARVQAALGELPQGWSTVRATLEEHGRAGRDRGEVLVHRDLHDGQLLDTGRGLAWLDFDLLSMGEDSLDAANLSVHLHLRAFQGLYGATAASADAAADALLDGLDRSGEPGFMQGLRFHQASTSLRLALVYSLRPRWSRIVPNLVTLARRCADELPYA